jgi:hypothetical protein
MEKKLGIFSLVLLLLVGSLAIGGGWMLVRDPSGYSMQLASEMLYKSPFNNYLVPGVILLLAIGFPSIVVAILGVRTYEYYPILLVFQAFILFGWLTIELLINIEFYHPLYHIPLYIIGLVLIVIGFILRNRKWEVRA